MGITNQTDNRVILVQAYSWQVLEGSLLKWQNCLLKSALQDSIAQNKKLRMQNANSMDYHYKQTHIYTNIDRGEETAVTEERRISYVCIHFLMVLILILININ